MSKIKFNVSAKTARLIGRENISDSNGAIIELVKNAYDADADTVYIEFNVIFENVPREVNLSFLKKFFNENEINLLLGYYNQEGDKLFKRIDLSDEDDESLKNVFFSKNKIIIFDNGKGMNDEILRTVWMNIGTNDKEVNAFSEKGRVRTGAKGIGRFALEKLSQKTIVYTKKKDNKLAYWSLDWRQFDKADLLSDINADIEILESDFSEKVSEYVDRNKFDKCCTDFKTGTIIILSGTRENWNEKVFNRINNNLKSINPFGNVDKFDVFVNNITNHKLDYIPESSTLSEEDYDYHILADYDGIDSVNITIKRNEVDLSSKVQIWEVKNQQYEFNIDDFWRRDAFNIFPYRKEDYCKKIINKYNIKDLLGDVSLEDVMRIGKFSLELYFLKSGNSEYSFIKEVKVNKRKKLLKNFSGVKIYRDSFKVRPYGEADGPMYDWLQLGGRVQNSPAGVSHPSGAWRVNTYQLIGNVKISRINNPNLEDMANRESLALNDTYFLFVELIQQIISKFEYDRQYVYREYGLWLKQNLKKINLVETIENSVINEKEKNQKSENEYSVEDYKETIYQVSNDKKYTIDTQKILMNFSSAGVTANTFAHEMKSVATKLASRNSQLKMCIDKILDGRELDESDIYNPYPVIVNYESTDNLLSKWLKIVMDSVSKESLEVENISIVNFINEVYDDWNGLLNEKHIETVLENDTNPLIECEKNDLYLIFNNLILNSAFYLEKDVHGNKRVIKTTIEELGSEIIIYFENNGPLLESKYASTPDIIFGAGVTSKDNGTGLGLWICKEAVLRNNGEIHVIPFDEGFKIKIKLPKEK